MNITDDMITADKSRLRWRKAFVGQLPPDFLRLSGQCENQETDGGRPASYQQQIMSQYVAPNHIGKLSVTCVQAKLTRNYGITRMDPYVRIRVGHYVYETQTDTNGGKNPHWGRVIQTQLPIGVNTLSVEIYDDCSFKMDELIAWCEIKIPERVMLGETHEEWFPLSGKQGNGLEGAIDLVLSFSNQAFAPFMYHPIPTPQAMLMVPPGRPMPIFVTQQHSQMPNPVASSFQINETDVHQIQDMFPNLSKELVETVLQTNRGNRDETINSLLRMNEL